MTRQILTAAAFVFVAATAGAQTVASTSILNQTQRQGTLMSSSFDIPLDSTISRITVQADIPTADYEDTRNSFMLNVEVFDEIAQAWKQDSGFGWRGGRQIGRGGVVNPPPTMGLDAVGFRGKRIRAVVDIPIQMRIGATVTVTTIP